MYEKLHGIDRDGLLRVVEPVLRAHEVDAVELMWRTDGRGRVLELTVERPGSRIPGEGVTLDLCAEISRDLSVALDVSDLIPTSYRLEVGSPGLERRLYSVQDYARFAGQLAWIKLKEPLEGQRVQRGTLQGLDDDQNILLSTERGVLRLQMESIESAHLVFDWNAHQRASGRDQGASGVKARHTRSAHRPERSR
jgi:ribosome maturation factor RimP